MPSEHCARFSLVVGKGTKPTIETFGLLMMTLIVGRPPTIYFSGARRSLVRNMGVPRDTPTHSSQLVHN